MTASSVSNQPTSSVDDPPAPMSAPDWDATTTEICCPLCGYNLRGLNEARCPECGSQFSWNDLLDTRRREHPYLFEHHPERNWWSFWRTLIGGLNPQAFWTTLHPMQPSSLRRLAIYGVVVLFLMSILAIASLVGYEIADSSLMFGQRSSWGWTPPQLTLLEYLERMVIRNADPEVLVPFVAPVAWAFVTFLSFMIFGISMKQARVKNSHVARAVVYSFDAVVLLWLAHLSLHWWRGGLLWYHEGDPVAALAFAAFIWTPLAVASYFWLTARRELREKRWANLIMWPIVTAFIGLTILLVEKVLTGNEWNSGVLGPSAVSPPLMLLAWAVVIGRLVTAFRQYLQFKHSVAVVLSTQIITPLALMVSMLVLGEIAKALGF